MLSLIFCVIFILIFLFLCYAGGNYLLHNMINNVLASESTQNKNPIIEKFQNKSVNQFQADGKINPLDECKKMDEMNQNTLNFQTGTNIPLSPNYYKDYVGNIYCNTEPIKETLELSKGNYCMKKPKLLYDGIWNPKMESNDDGFEYQNWNLTKGNLYEGYYCSDKLLQVNKDIPPNFKDMSATLPVEGGEYYNYLIDSYQDPLDTQLHCFGNISPKDLGYSDPDKLYVKSREPSGIRNTRFPNNPALSLK